MTSDWIFPLLLYAVLFQPHYCVALADLPQQPPQKRRKFGSKVSSVTLSEIDMMRRLVLNVLYTPPSWKKRASACSWKGVKCNAESQVTRIRWCFFKLSGNLTWSYLPPHVTYFNAENDVIERTLAGTLRSIDLIAPLEIFNVAEHKHRGVFDFTTLPVQLKELTLRVNELEGPVDLTQLPPKIRTIFAENNHFVGPIKLHALPPGMYALALSHNKLTGTLDFDHLPKSMGFLILDNNRLEGTLNLSSLPRLLNLDVSMNQLTGVTSGIDRYWLDYKPLRGNLFDLPL